MDTPPAPAFRSPWQATLQKGDHIIKLDGIVTAADEADAKKKLIAEIADSHPSFPVTQLDLTAR